MMNAREKVLFVLIRSRIALDSDLIHAEIERLVEEGSVEIDGTAPALSTVRGALRALSKSGEIEFEEMDGENWYRLPAPAGPGKKPRNLGTRARKPSRAEIKGAEVRAAVEPIRRKDPETRTASERRRLRRAGQLVNLEIEYVQTGRGRRKRFKTAR